MKNKLSISHYTEQEFIELVETIFYSRGTESHLSDLVNHFNAIVGHPKGADLLSYPDDDVDDSVEGVVGEVKKWRAANYLLGFKDSK